MIGRFYEPLYEVRVKTKRFGEEEGLFTNRELLIAGLVIEVSALLIPRFHSLSSSRAPTRDLFKDTANYL
ncbi:MAG: hypothetical protein JWO44_2468 [Bacteroidetes bacterium]|nr:hypothetical protein [Bacteroidota bacterium]